ncbi:MAG: MFS transporter [Anaerolinea sp.]|nr:MFS transporter [Anaerolinea sp.]
MLTMVILVGLGEKMAERFLPIYVLALGGSTLVVGILNGIDNLLSALYSFPGGYIADRFGYKKALAIFNLIAIFGYLIVILFPSWPAVLVAAIFFLSWSSLSLPATMSLVNRVIPNNKRTMGVSMNSIMKRIPMALGPLLGGYMIYKYGETDGVRIAFGIALILAVIALIFQQRMIEDFRPAHKAERNPLKLMKYMSPNLRNLLISDILVRFAEQIPYAFVVIWAMKNVGISSVQFGILTTIEMVTAVLIYIPVAYLADKSSKKPFVLITFGFFAIFPAVLFISNSFGLLVIAFIIRGLKEFGEPTRKALIMDLAPEDKKAGMFGLYYLLRDVIVAAAAVGGAYLWNISPLANFAMAAGFGVLGVFYFAFFGRDMGRSEVK